MTIERRVCGWIGHAALAAGLLSGCGGEDTWEAPDFEANTTEAVALREQISTLVGGMRNVEEGAAFDAAALTADYEAGSPSLASVTHAGFSPIMDDSFAEFGELAMVGPADLVDESGAWTPGEQGGIAGESNRGLNEGGIEIRQIVDKGLFSGGALYAYAAGLSVDADAADIEAIAAAWGADATLTAEGELNDSAAYAATMGMFDQIAQPLTTAHANAADAATRDAALEEAFRAWELAMVARFVYYLDAALGIVQAEVTDESVAEASHDLSEGIGLVLGFHGMPNPSGGPLAGGARVATDAQIEAILGAIGVNASDLGASTTGELLADPAAFATAQGEAEAAIASAFGLSAVDVAAWREEVASE